MPRASEKSPDVKLFPCNEDGLTMLAQQRDSYMLWYGLASAGTLGLLLAGTVAGLVLLGASFGAANGTSKCVRLEKALKQLLVEEFRQLGIEAFPLLLMREATDHEHIDLYVRFPGLTQIFIAIRSEEGRTVVYNEAKEKFQARKPGKRGLNNLRPCPLTILNKGKSWLSRNRQAFGLSSRQATKTPTVRVLVIWGKTQIAKHRDELYAQVGNSKYLSVKKDGATTFVIYQEDLVKFMKDWLSDIRQK